MTVVVKVQRPMVPPDGPWLVYDRANLHVVSLPTIPHGVRSQMGDDFKAYFHALWADGRWHIGNRVKSEGW